MDFFKLSNTGRDPLPGRELAAVYPITVWR